MDLKKTKSAIAETIYPVGTKVRFKFGRSEVVGRITEDRGKIGYGGRRLYGIRYFEEEEESRYTELPAEEFCPVSQTGK